MVVDADGTQNADPSQSARRARRAVAFAALLGATALGTLATFSPSVAVAAVTAPANAAVKNVALKKGDSLESAIMDAGASRADASEAARALAKQVDPRKLKIGQQIEVHFTEAGGKRRLWSVRLPLSSTSGLMAVASSTSFAVRAYDPSAVAETDVLPAGTLPRIEGGLTAKSAQVQTDQTLMVLALELGANRSEADKAIIAVGKLFNVRRLQVGQTITLTFGENSALIGLAIALEGGVEVAAYLSDSGVYEPLRTTPEERLQMAAEAEALRTQQLRATAPLPPPVTAPAPVNDIATVTDIVARGDTLLEVAVRLGAVSGDALTASQALSSVFNLRMLRVGQLVTAVFGHREPGEPTKLLALSLTVDAEEEVVALLGEEGRFEVITTTPEGRDRMIAAAQGQVAPDGAGAMPADAAPMQLAEDPADLLVRPQVLGFEHQVKTLIVTRGDTLLDAAITLGAKHAEATGAIGAIADIFDPRSLKVGQVIEATFGRLQSGAERRLLAFGVAVSPSTQVLAFLSEGGDYASRQMSREEHEQLLAALGNAPATAPAPVPQPVPAAAAPAANAATAAPVRAPAPAPAPAPTRDNFDWIATIDRTVSVRPGDTLMEAVLRSGATPQDAHEAIVALTKIFNPRQLQAGQSIRVTYGDQDAANWGNRLLAINVKLDVEKEVAALRSRSGDFSPREIVREFDVRSLRVSGNIDDSLYAALDKAGVPANTLIEMIRVFSWDVDFQRDIQPGDRFEVFFDQYVDEDGKRVKDGNIQYAALTLSGREVRLYRFEGADGVIDYYNDQGQSARKALLRTPIDGARLSSTFGLRRHPILGYSRMHQGIDFAAPAGTPIKAAGDGIIEMAAPNSGYGNYVLIKHTSDYKTAYAHMQKFATGVRPGVRVRQGQTIGYVGSTGLATGPHLHYEILRLGKQVNPDGVKMPTGKKLEGRELLAFANTKKTVDVARAKAPEFTTVAAR